MKKECLVKTLALSIVFLFVIITVTPALGVTYYSIGNTPLITTNSFSFQQICILFSIYANQELVLSFTDFTDDVLDATTGKKVSRPNIDIYKISALQEGNIIELKLQLIDSGVIENSSYTFYEIDLETDLHSYFAYFGGGEIIVTDENDTDIDIINYSGIGTNELSILFNLYNSYEECLNLSAATFEFKPETEEGYYDEFPNQAIRIFIFGKYTNMSVEDNFISIESVNIWIIERRYFPFIPIKFIHISAGEQIAFSKDYQGIITKQFIIGFFNVYKY